LRTMKDRPLLLVKLGGSCLTNKSEFETIAEHRFQETIGQLVQAICSSPHIDYIVIHGAGSFGHFHARKYQVFVAIARTATLHTMC
jgi:isopentenyl phosphate kinase